MDYYLGVDGGGTKCRAALCDAEGVILGRADTGPANIISDAAGSRGNVLQAARAAAAAAHLDLRVETCPTVLGLAGANVSDAAQAFAATLPFTDLRVETDAVIALKGAFGSGDGTVAILGTGSVFCSQREGHTRTIGGWGPVLGDEGSGAWLGRRLMQRSLLAHDRLVEPSELLDEILLERGGAEQMVAFAARATPSDFAKLAPRLISAVSAGDAGALSIWSEAKNDVSAAIDAASADASTSVAFLGGLGATYRLHLSEMYGPRIVNPAGDALDGALAMARGLA